MRHGVMSTPRSVAIVLLAVVAAGGSKRSSRDIDVVAKIQRLGPCILSAQVAFPIWIVL